MVGIVEGRIREQERIIAMLYDVTLTSIDPETQEVIPIDMDWTDFIEEIREGDRQ